MRHAFSRNLRYRQQFYFLLWNRGRQAVQVERRKRKFEFKIPEPQEVQLVRRGERGGAKDQPEKEFRINQQIQVNIFDIDDVIDLKGVNLGACDVFKYQLLIFVAQTQKHKGGGGVQCSYF
jgi:hypothetical protein